LASERRLLRITGTVQGVGFRPFVYRLAREHGVAGWVRNDGGGVTIEVLAEADVQERFAAAIRDEAPAAAKVDEVTTLVIGEPQHDPPAGFVIVDSDDGASVTTAISPDLCVCDDCLREMRDPTDRRYGYPYITCTNCGPRYSIIQALPYDRPLTTMRGFALCEACDREYHDPLDRRFHAQPVACPRCGPRVRFLPSVPARGQRSVVGEVWDGAAIDATAQALVGGSVVAVKGLGGYHLACDATHESAVRALRERKFRKEKPFAVMARDLEVARRVVELPEAAVAALSGSERPIVLLPRLPGATLEGLAPDNAYLGIMLPYTPLHHLLFDAGAPPLLVMTSANRSSEPIAYGDDEAFERLAALADAFLVGERPIARRVDDSVVQVVGGAAAVSRRARGYAPAPVARGPAFERPRLALGAELKSSVALAVDGAAYVSQHLGDLSDLDSFTAFTETVYDLCAMYRLDPHALPVVHDRHPGYPSSRFAHTLGGPRLEVQHHVAHVASVAAERGAWDVPLLGFAFDGAGLGDDGVVWGGEVFHGSLVEGFTRVAHLREAFLPGGDAAARAPVQAAAGWLHALGDDVWERVARPPVGLSDVRLGVARRLIEGRLHTFRTTSMGRLFDTVAALTGFHRTMTFEGQAAIALEAMARRSSDARAYPWPFDGTTFDHAPLLDAVLVDLERGAAAPDVARRFHETIALGVVVAAQELRKAYPFERLVVSGGVFQNALLLERLGARLDGAGVAWWGNARVPANDGGVSLGQLALGAFLP
jgi:hydrogenase maturation protein HypF